VVVFAVIMVMSMMLPSLSQIFTSSSSSSSATTAETSATTDATTDSDTAATTEATTASVSYVDSEYSSTVSTLESKLDGDPNNLATLINVANDYFAWGYNALSYATTDDEKTHVNDLFTKAEGYYDRYLALNDSGSAHVDRALCQYYSGDTDGAISALESYTQQDPTFASAWANLGMIYYADNRTDDAEAAFQKGIDNDPDDKYGVKTYAEQYLSYISSAETAATSSSTGTSSDATTSGSSSYGTSLSDALASASGTTL
jgi:tetratricopeptide (TPR) repeat protein